MPGGYLSCWEERALDQTFFRAMEGWERELIVVLECLYE